MTEKLISKGRKVLKEFLLPVDKDTFLNEFWLNSVWYNNFLINNLKDVNVEIGEWEANYQSGQKMRKVTVDHPNKVKFPGLSKYAKVKHFYRIYNSKFFDFLHHLVV
jgi:hypothetical protein